MRNQLKRKHQNQPYKKQIIDWVIENTTDRVFKNHFEFDTTTTPWTVDYYNGAALYFSPKVSSINGNGLFQWGKVYCMRIYNNQNIENFEGGPKKVNTLQIKNCPKFESLEDGPEEVDYLLQILNCPEFKILPQIKEAFYIRIENCPKLEYLNGCADEVNEFKIIDSGLKSLKGGPKKAYDYLVSKNKLTSLEGGPEEVISDFVINNWYFILGGLILIVLIFMLLYKTSKGAKYAMQSFVMHIPVVKEIIKYNQLVTFTSTFSTLIKHDVFITDSMDILSKITENEIYKKIIKFLANILLI